MGKMNKEVEVIVYGVKLNIVVAGDIHVKGSFDPSASSDYEYYGYRETDFTVVSGYFYSTAYDREIEMLHDDLYEFLDENCMCVEAAIQQQLDKEREECLLYDEPYDHGEELYS